MLGENYCGFAFAEYKEAKGTKHVHRLHPYKGEFIPQLVEYFLDTYTDKFKKEVYFKQEIQKMSDADVRNVLTVSLIGKEFRNFLDSEGAYETVLDCFEEVGIELRADIDRFFERF
ncbi:hypothetical protein H5T88_06255 [bacterium]|nr:hypothetical protein [bacterium]